MEGKNALLDSKVVSSYTEISVVKCDAKEEVSIIEGKIREMKKMKEIEKSIRIPEERSRREQTMG